MKKEDIVNEVAKIVGTKNKAQIVVNSILSQIKDTLQRKEIFTISGFGSFKVSQRKARMGVNPRTGETMKFEAVNVPKFSAGKMLKGLVNDIRD